MWVPKQAISHELHFTSKKYSPKAEVDPHAPWTSVTLTCVPQLLVPINRENDQKVAQDINYDSEYEEAAQSCSDPRWAIQCVAIGVLRAVQIRPIYNHCIYYAELTRNSLSKTNNMRVKNQKNYDINYMVGTPGMWSPASLIFPSWTPW